ncbi:MAG TPA: site-2 protease family protein [Patescibacteria group bacterium]|nr:site-2 protease family protein [Patescibacteria group bacterium]
MLQIFGIIILIFSAIIHEYMHGWMAERLGDNTAKDAGRLTLNPIPHLDLFGSIILPSLMALSGTGIIFGWAKPVPFNPNNLSDKKWGSAKVAIAGPLGNLIIALMLGLTLRFLEIANPTMIALFAMAILINLVLMIFNLMPIPPLDGSKVIMPFLPFKWQMQFIKLERYGMILVIIFIFFAFDIIIPVTFFLMRLIVGNGAMMQISMMFGV